jgi:hypothetical protein
MLDKKRFKIGASASYIQIGEIARIMGVETRHITALCTHLEVPMLSFPGQTEHYILVYALETALFSLGLPKTVQTDPALSRAHQELAALTYGVLTKEALQERVSLIVKSLTNASEKGKMKRPSSSWRKWTGRQLER